MVRLSGSTGSHAGGYPPLVASARAYQMAHPEVEIQWGKRSLQDLADFPVEALAQTYDLLIIDHPSVGASGYSGCIVPLDELLPKEALSILAKQTVGRSRLSYN